MEFARKKNKKLLWSDMIVKDKYRYRLIAVLRVKTDIITSISASDNVCCDRACMAHLGKDDLLCIAYCSIWSKLGGCKALHNTTHFLFKIVWVVGLSVWSLPTPVSVKSQPSTACQCEISAFQHLSVWNLCLPMPVRVVLWSSLQPPSFDHMLQYAIHNKSSFPRWAIQAHGSL
jgi:hypothetical protein